MSKLFLIILTACFFNLLFLTGCSLELKRTVANSNVTAVNSKPDSNLEIPLSNSQNSNTPVIQPEEQPMGKYACFALKRDNLAVDKNQTFSLDFKPFENSCFVTFHDPKFVNPPLGSQFFIYRNGVEIFDFPHQFGGGNTTCWVTAVSFADLNGDQLQDITVAGKCGGKEDTYNENMVYVNDGKTFITNVNSNAETMDFSQINEIQDFVKKNPELFNK